VIDNVVWTDTWPSIASADCGLIRIGAKGLSLAGPPRSGETSKLSHPEISNFRI
jgi:hypothetical protein